MSIEPHDAANKDQKNGYLAEGLESLDEELELTSVDIAPKALQKHESQPRSNGFLSAPLTAPVRPLSPDTISQLSVDEYEQLAPSRRALLSADDDAQEPRVLPGWRGKVERFWQRNRGLAYMLCAMVFGTAMNVTTRLLEVEGNKGKGLHPFQVLFARMGITLVLASGYMWYTKTPHFPLGLKEVRWLLVARGMGGFFGVFGMYYSLLYLPLADATVITFLAPGLACWACSILINEPFTRREQLAGLVSLVGVILISRPTSLFSSGSSGAAPPASGSGDVASTNTTTAPAPSHSGNASSYEDVDPSQRLTAVGIALLGVLGGATAFTTIRWIGKRAHPLLSVNYFAAWCFFVSIVMQTFLPGVGFLLPADLKEWGYLFFLGTCGFIMQFLMAAGLAYEKSSRATNITYTQMLFALAADKIFFDHSPGWMSIIGSALILGSAIVVALQQSAAKGKEVTEGSRSAADEESQRGLISGLRVDMGDEAERLPVQEVQMRTLR